MQALMITSAIMFAVTVYALLGAMTGELLDVMFGGRGDKGGTGGEMLVIAAMFWPVALPFGAGLFVGWKLVRGVRLWRGRRTQRIPSARVVL